MNLQNSALFCNLKIQSPSGFFRTLLSFQPISSLNPGLNSSVFSIFLRSAIPLSACVNLRSALKPYNI